MENMETGNYDNGGESGVSISPAVDNQVRKLLQEKLSLDGHDFPNANRLIDEELKKIVETKKQTFDRRYIDVFNNRPVKLSTKVLVPAVQFPHVNYLGKLLGYKGSTLKQLQEMTDCRMFILGKGSMRNKEKEAEYLQSGDPKYSHLSDVLHVEVTCLAPACEAYDKMSFAVNSLRKFLVPDPQNDVVPDDIRRLDEEAVRYGKSRANVLSLVEKARHSMAESQPAPTFRRGRGFGRGRGSPYYRKPNAAPSAPRFSM